VLHKTNEFLLFVVLEGAHYALVKVHIRVKKVEVFDGFTLSLKTWKDGITSVLKRYGLLPNTSRSVGALTYNDRETPFAYQTTKMTATNTWDVFHGPGFQQSDSHSCGPLACAHAFNILHNNKEESKMTGTAMEVREWVMSTYKEMLEAHNLPYIAQVQFEDLTASCNIKDIPIVVSPPLPSNDDSAFERMHSSERKRRLKSLNEAKGRQRQDKANKKMKKYFMDSIKVEVGETVLIHVDRDQRSRGVALGFPAIVYAVSESKSVKAVTQNGILSEGTKKKPFWVPYDKWTLKEAAVLPAVLLKIQDSIHNKTFDEKEERLISVKTAQSQLHEHNIVGATRCGCKKQCTSHSCRCKLAGTLCYSGCGCGGNCLHTLTKVEEFKKKLGK
jgi:hypothetical protein